MSAQQLPEVPVFRTPYTIVQGTDASGKRGYQAKWTRRTVRETQNTHTASPVFGDKGRVRAYMANVYEDAIEGRVAE